MKAKLILRLLLHFILLGIYWVCTLLSKGFNLAGKGIDKLLELNTEHTDKLMDTSHA